MKLYNYYIDGGFEVLILENDTEWEVHIREKGYGDFMNCMGWLKSNNAPIEECLTDLTEEKYLYLQLRAEREKI